MSTLQQVVVRSSLVTLCPNGGEDENEVAVSWKPLSDWFQLIEAEKVHAIVAGFSGQSMYCEHLAMELASRLGQELTRLVTVTVRQVSGHGVEATASS